MIGRSLDDWLQWQESLNAGEINLGLDRIAKVANRLDLQQPAGSVFVIAGTNGKGSCVWLLEQLLQTSGARIGAYTSPHLLKYNERIRIDGAPVDDRCLVRAFERIESASDGQALTYFEYGTLAALWIFSNASCDAWILEVGLGGRLDAVNIVEPDYSLLTTIALDHQKWLGNDVEQIAREKAGIMRLGTPAFFGVKPDLVFKSGSIAAAIMGDPNASIPTPQPEYLRPMFASVGRSLAESSVSFVSQAAFDGDLAGRLGLSRPLLPGGNTRDGIGKGAMVHNDATPSIEVDPETYEVRADGVLLTCEPADRLPMAQRYFLY